MIEQQGRVVTAIDERAVVRLGGMAGCSACDAGRGCGAGIFGRLLRRRPVDLTFDNHLQAGAGQAVVVGLPEAWFLRLVARFYLFPLLAGLVAAAFGHYLVSMFGAATWLTDLASLVAAVLAGWWAVRRNRQWSAQFPDAMDVHLLRVAENDKSIIEQEVVS